MIKKIQNSDSETAKKIQKVFLKSYAVEAKILEATDFPPLKRPFESYVKSDNDFIAFFKGQEIAGITEIKINAKSVYIQSLVVHPDYFRQGIADQLLEFVFSTYSTPLFTVETGVNNHPAVRLYLKKGFKEVKQWDTDFGIRKVRFEKQT